MKIVILGAGKMGTSIIDNFIDDESDLVVIDNDLERLQLISAKYDLMVIHGDATDLEVLDRADLKSADLLVAATQYDEINIMACKMAHELYHVPYKIARLRDSKYLNHRDRLFTSNIFPIDYIVEPTNIMAQAINNLIRYPGVEYVTFFCSKKLAVYACKAEYGGVFVGRSIPHVNEELRRLEIGLAAIMRNGVLIQLTDYTIVNAGDQIVLVSEPENIMLALGHFQKALPKPKRIMLAGGSRINRYLATFLRDKASIKLIEANPQKARSLANEMSNILVIAGDCADDNLLFEEKIDSTDIYVAATGQDNMNILSAVQAKRMGCKRAIAVIGKSFNRSLIHNEEIDIIYSGQNDLATEIRSQGMVSVFSRVYKDPTNTYQTFQFTLGESFANKPTKQEYGAYKLPNGISFIALVRKGQFKLITAQTVLMPGDKIVAITDANAESLATFSKLYAKSVQSI